MPQFMRKFAILPVIFSMFFGIALFKYVYAWSLTDAPLSYTLFSTTPTYPYQMNLDSSGNLYVATTGANKIYKYNSSGSLVTSFGTASSGPTGVAIAGNGNIIVANYQQDKVETWSSDGSFISTFGSTGSGNNQFSSPYAIAVDSAGNIYVADAGNNRVQKFNSSMTYQSTITGNGGAFNFPESVDVDGSDNLYVLDSGNNRVQVFNSSGSFVRTITGNGGAWDYPEGMTVDNDGNLYVADSGHDKIQVFDSGGTFKQQFGSSGTSLGQFQYIAGLAITSGGILYVGDQDRIQKVTFDRGSATITITSTSGQNTEDTTPVVQGTATDALSNLTAIQYSVDDGTYQSCTADDGAIDETSEAFTCAVSPAVGGGSHTVSVRATDSYTNTNSGGNLGTFTFNEAFPAAGTSNSCGTTAPSGYPFVTQVVRNGGSITIGFNPPSNASSFAIEYGTTQSAQYAGNFNANGTGTQTYTLGSLRPSSDYYFRLRGGNGCATGPWGAWTQVERSSGGIVTNTFTPPPTLSQPIPLLVTPGPTSELQVHEESLNNGADPANDRQGISGFVEKITGLVASEEAPTYAATGAGTFAATAATIATFQAAGLLFFVYRNSGRSVLKFPIDLTVIMLGWTKQIFDIVPIFRRKSTGVVFDSESGSPLSGALIVFFSGSGNLKTTYSDSRGKYVAFLKPDEYRLRVDKDLYVFPSKVVKSRDSGVYKDIYLHPENITVYNEKDPVKDMSIALDPIKSGFKRTFDYITRLLLYTGFAYLLFGLIVKFK